ncbi:unnamed protein product, partial [Phaeothamnion confervicola]
SVREEYATYQFWDTVQALCSYLRGVLSTAAVLDAAGVGEGGASALAAAVVWVLRDGFGMAGSLIFAWAVGGRMDADIKAWRLFADVINDVGLMLDMLAPVAAFRQHLAIVSSLGTVCKAMCGVAAGCTKASITAHLALRANTADVSAKESAQETAVTLIGILVGVQFARWLGGDGSGGDYGSCGGDGGIDVGVLGGTGGRHAFGAWGMFLLLTALHVYANHCGVSALNLTTVNEQRARILVAAFAHHCLESVGTAAAADGAADTAGSGDGYAGKNGCGGGSGGGDGGASSDGSAKEASALESSSGLADAATGAAAASDAAAAAGAVSMGAVAEATVATATALIRCAAEMRPQAVSQQERVWLPLWWCLSGRRRRLGIRLAAAAADAAAVRRAVTASSPAGMGIAALPGGDGSGSDGGEGCSGSGRGGSGIVRSNGAASGRYLVLLGGGRGPAAVLHRAATEDDVLKAFFHLELAALGYSDSPTSVGSGGSGGSRSGGGSNCGSAGSGGDVSSSSSSSSNEVGSTDGGTGSGSQGPVPSPEARLTKMVEAAYPLFRAVLTAGGWDMEHLLLRPEPWRCEWRLGGGSDSGPGPSAVP